MRDWRSFSHYVLVLFVLALPAAYVGSYYALVERDSGWNFLNEDHLGRGLVIDEDFSVQWPSTYGSWDGFLHPLFWPMEIIDRNIRRDYWGELRGGEELLIDVVTSEGHWDGFESSDPLQIDQDTSDN